MNNYKIVVYQIFTRLFGNNSRNVKINGNRNENGVGKLKDISEKALLELKKLGITHIWYTGIIEHLHTKGYPDYEIKDGNPLIIKGNAGSPYAISDYYDVDPDLAINITNRMNEFQELVERTHKYNLNVIIDFVPNHVSRQYHSDVKPENIKDFGVDDITSKDFDPNNNFYYLPDEELKLPKEIIKKFPEFHYQEFPVKVTGNDQFTANPTINDWYETIKLNYGTDILHEKKKHFTPIPATWVKMEEILTFWANKGVDGFRCDMAEMVPVEFWHWVISRIKSKFKNIVFIAEIYNPIKYSGFIKYGNFDFLYDKVGLYDTLKEIIQGNNSAKAITKCWQDLNELDKFMLRFLENHDEQRIASKYFAGNPFKAFPAFIVAATLHQSPVMLYFGQEVGEPAIGESGFSGDDGRTTIFDYWNVPEHQKWMNNGKFDGGLLSKEQIYLRKQYNSLLILLNKNEAIFKGNFYDLMWYNQDRNIINSDKIYAFLRYTEKQILLIVVNFDNKQQKFQLKIPEHAFESLSLNKNLMFVLSEIFPDNSELKIVGNEFIKTGIMFKLESYGSVIFNVNPTREV